MIRKIALSVAYLSCSTLSPAWADDENESAATSVSETNEESIVVTGYRGSAESSTVLSNRPVLDTPFSVNSLGSELLVDQQAISFTDVVRNDPSIVLAFPQFDDTINLRGFYQNVLYREGLPTSAQVRAPFQNKERVDVFKGLSGFRYGFNSPGGVINFVVKRPTEEPQVTALFGGDDHGSLYGHLDVGGRFGPDNQFGFRGNVFLHDFNSFRKDVTGRQKLYSAIVDWRVTSDLTLEADYEYMRSSNSVWDFNLNAAFGGDVARARAILPQIRPNITPAQPWTIEDRYHSLLRLRADYRISDDWKFAIFGHIVDGDRPYQSPIAYNVQADGSYTLGLYLIDEFTLDFKTLAATLDGSFNLFGFQNDISFGYTRDDRRNFGSGSFFTDDVSGYVGGVQRGNLFTGATVSGFLPPSGTPGSFGGFAFAQRTDTAFVNNTLNIGDNVQALFGLTYGRLKAFNPTAGTTTFEDSAISPVLGLVFKPAANSSFYASYATGLEEGQSPPTTAANFSPNPFPPIKSEQFEVGFKYELSSGALATLALFQIDKGLAYVNSANVFVQDGIQRHRGVELTVLGKVTPNLQLAGGVTYLDAKVAEAAQNVGKTLPGIGKLRYSLFADWKTPFADNLYLTGGIQGDSKKFVTFNNDYALPGYAIFDLGARYELGVADKRFIARLGVQNLLDKRFYESVDFYSGIIFGTSRTFKASLAVEF